MGLLSGFKGIMSKWLGIIPAQTTLTVQIRETTTPDLNVLKNRIWYRGDPQELEQFFKQLAQTTTDSWTLSPATRFWAATPSGDTLVRKLHSGLPKMIVNKLAEIVSQDMLPAEGDTADTTAWCEICCENDFEELIKEAIQQCLTDGDGAFKICVDTDLSQSPLIEFYSGSDVEYTYKRRKLVEVQFFTTYTDSKTDKKYKLVEYYGKNYVKYKLFDSIGAECSLNSLSETQGLVDVEFTGDYIMAVPLKFSKSPKWADRGESLFDAKSDMFDAFDEVLSTWMDALRAGRVKQYIPESLIPRDADNGNPIKPDVFNPYIAVGSILAEDMKEHIEVKQGDINYEGLLLSYTTILDACLQGIISPSTLGIDVKKTDNAESQREKEKTTLYTRDSLIKVLGKVLPKLAEVCLKTSDNMKKQAPTDYELTFEWGQYASPGFDSQVETIGKAKTYGIMSTEQCVEELYGDSMSDDDKAEEVARIKAEANPTTVTGEPSVNDDMGMNNDDTMGQIGFKAGEENATE